MLTVRNLTIEIGAKAREPGSGKGVVNRIGFDLAPGECLGIVGESGSGKSMVALAIMGLLPAVARAAGSITLDGDELLAFNDAAMDRVRGSRIGMIFQEPMTALNPAMTVGRQIAEGLRVRAGMTKGAARAEALRLMERVRLPEARRRLDLYPHEMSGGQRQRIVIAIAIALKPRLLIADEPTTALDVTVQKDILDLLDDLSREAAMAVLLISHDLGVIARMADRTLVMQQGVCRESGRTADILRAPRDDYTSALIGALPRRTRASLERGRAAASPAGSAS